MAINLFSKTDNSNVAEQISNNSEEKIIVLTSILDEIKVMRNSLKTMVNLKKDKEQDAIAAAKEEKRSNIGKIDSIIPIIAHTPKISCNCSIVISTPLCSKIAGSIVLISKNEVDAHVYIPSKPASNKKIPAIKGL